MPLEAPAGVQVGKKEDGSQWLQLDGCNARVLAWQLEVAGCIVLFPHFSIELIFRSESVNSVAFFVFSVPFLGDVEGGRVIFAYVCSLYGSMARRRR